MITWSYYVTMKTISMALYNLRNSDFSRTGLWILVVLCVSWNMLCAWLMVHWEGMIQEDREQRRVSAWVIAFVQDIDQHED
jgi:hypothetical protein